MHQLKNQGIIDLLVLYVREFLVLVHASCFVANKSLNVQIFLVLVPKVKIRRKI
jgi:hypothetical protein